MRLTDEELAHKVNCLDCEESVIKIFFNEHKCDPKTINKIKRKRLEEKEE